jgi:hypothetical protein
VTGARDTAQSVTAQGHYAGAVSRLLAFIVDLASSSALFALALAAVSYVATILSGYAWDARAARLSFLAREAELARIPPDG